MPHALNPISESSDGLFENNPDKTSVEKFKFFHADEGKPLATPWQVALSRAMILRKYQLPKGVILDCACGSGIQLAAYSEILKKPVVGIELNEKRARASAVNFRTVFTERGDASIDRLQDSRIIVGDGRDGGKTIDILRQEFREEEDRKVAFLHLDPARPRNSRDHELSEMAPRLDEVFEGWKSHLVVGPNGPTILLDLSPRLSHSQMLEVESIVEQFWPNTEKTWTWTSRGRGRVDRLALWMGEISEPNFSRRFVRIPPDPKLTSFEMLGGKSLIEGDGIPVSSERMPKRGEYATLVDSALVESGMADDWLKSTDKELDYDWVSTTGRRPTIYHSKPLKGLPPEAKFLIQCTGRVLDLIHSELTLETVDEFVKICLENDISKLTIRASLDPAIHPKLQGSFDRQLSKRHGSREAFLLRRPNQEIYLLCIS